MRAGPRRREQRLGAERPTLAVQQPGKAVEWIERATRASPRTAMYWNNLGVARRAAGEDVDPSLYQFRITLRFETSAPQYAWLNRTVGVGSAMRLGNAVVYDAFEVK